MPTTVTTQTTKTNTYTSIGTRTYTTTGTYTLSTPQTLACILYPGNSYNVTAAKPTSAVTYRLTSAQTSAWSLITQPYMPQNPQYSQYEEGHLPGTYGPVPNLYFKLVYPVYVIHRYYEKTECTCDYYSPPPGGGVAPPSPRWNGTPPQVCDIVVKRNNDGEITSIIVNCKLEALEARLG
jgi:hypothetical protein